LFTSPYPDEVIPKLSVFDFLFTELNADDAERVALVDGPSGAETTYGALKAQIELLAGALAARGIGIGDVIALHSPNVPAFATVFHGILRSGATATTVNALYTGEEMARQLQDSKAKMLFTVSPLLPVASVAAAAAGIPDSQIVVLDGFEGYTGLRDLLGEGHAAPDVSFDRGSRRARRQLRPFDTRGGHPVLLRNHRIRQRCHAQPHQPGGECRAVHAGARC